MKRITALVSILLVCVLAGLCCAETAQISEEWAESPVITKAYEHANGKLYLEWEGNASIYQIYLDSKKVADVAVKHHVIDIQKGSHTILIYPVDEIRNENASTKVDLSVDSDVIGSAGVSIDLAALGLDPKKLTTGNPSEKLIVDYKPTQIVNIKPEDLDVYIDADNRAILSFADNYNSDEYELMIKHKNDTTYLTYNTGDEKAKELITRNGSRVSLLLEPDFLRAQECMVPEENEEYRVTVQLRKYAVNLINGEKEISTVYDSKVSSEYAFKVIPLWKTAPVITFASQTADGELTLQWDHQAYSADCEYIIMKINKVLGVMSGEEELGRTAEKEYKVKDLNNGGYCINIVPIVNGEKGTYSKDANVEIKNEWVAAPTINCEQIGSNQVKLTWKAPANIEKYHITVSKGDNASLLRYIDMDYSKYTEFDLEAAEGDMEHVYSYDGDMDPEAGVKLKFEIYGIRHAENGQEQKSAASSKTIILK